MLLGILTRVSIPFRYGAFTLYGWLSHAILLDTRLVTLLGYQGHPVSPTTPILQRPYPWHSIGLGSSPFARRYLESRVFFPFLQVLRCFSSLRTLPLTRILGDESQAVSRFGHLRIKACLAAPRSFSQPNHVLHRPWTPRHPPCTLRSLTTLFLVRRSLPLPANLSLVLKERPPDGCEPKPAARRQRSF